jgi:hypothetical protein
LTGDSKVAFEAKFKATVKGTVVEAVQKNDGSHTLDIKSDLLEVNKFL